MCDCHFKVQIIQIFGAMNGDLVVGGDGDVVMGCMQNRIGKCGRVRHWRLSVLTFTPLLRFLPKASVVIHLDRVAGIKNSGSHVTYSFRHAGACCQG